MREYLAKMFVRLSSHLSRGEKASPRQEGNSRIVALSVFAASIERKLETPATVRRESLKKKRRLDSHARSLFPSIFVACAREETRALSNSSNGSNGSAYGEGTGKRGSTRRHRQGIIFSSDYLSTSRLDLPREIFPPEVIDHAIPSQTGEASDIGDVVLGNKKEQLWKIRRISCSLGLMLYAI